MTNRRYLILATCVAACAGAMPFAAAAEGTTILLNSFIQPQHAFNTRVLKPWADDVTKATEGRVKFDIPPASLAAPPQQMEAVQKGIVDAAYAFHGFLGERIKLTQIAHLPFINGSAKGSSVALWRTYEKYFAKANEYKDVQLLGLFMFPGGTTFGMKGPIKQVSDLKGTKMYALAGVPAEIMEAAGAGVVAAPAVRSYEMISSGTVDAFAGYAVMDAATFKTLQYAKSVTDVPGSLTAPAFALFVNKKKWASIASKDRDTIVKLSGEALAQRLAVLDEIESKARADAKAGGIDFITADASFVAALKKFAQPLETAWLADAEKLGVDGKAALAYFKQQAEATK